jgi:hypothetical protein
MRTTGMLQEALFIGLDQTLIQDAESALKSIKSYSALLGKVADEFKSLGRVDFQTYSDQFEKFFQDKPLASVVELKMRLALDELSKTDAARAQKISKQLSTYPDEFINNLSQTYRKPVQQLMREDSNPGNVANFLAATQTLLNAFRLELEGGEFNNRTALIPTPGMAPGSLMKFWRSNVLDKNQTATATLIEGWRLLNSKQAFPNQPEMQPRHKKYRAVTQSLVQQFEIGRIKEPELAEVFTKALGWEDHWVSTFADCWLKPVDAMEGHKNLLVATQNLSGFLSLPKLSSLNGLKEGRAGTDNKPAAELLEAHFCDVTHTLLVEDDAFAELPSGAMVTIGSWMPQKVRDGMYLLGVQSPELGELSIVRIFKADKSDGTLRLKASDSGKSFDFHSFDTQDPELRGTADSGIKGLNIRILGRIIGIYFQLSHPGDF